MHDTCKIWLQYVIPQHFLSLLMFSLTHWRWRLWKNTLINFVIKKYQVDMTIAEYAKADEYVHFNAFFTRRLKPDARPVNTETGSIISPVDALISAAGRIDGETIYQAKARQYSLNALLASEQSLLPHYTDGDFATLYLSPSDYHRIHMPIDGELESMIYVPGCLFSVNALTTKHVDALFARNERVICTFNTAAGKVSLIMIAAIFVGGMTTIWHGQITPGKGDQIQRCYYTDKPPALPKGAEMGRFNMGSTVIMLLERDRINWSQQMQAGNWLAMGSKIGEFLPAPNSE